MRDITMGCPLNIHKTQTSRGWNLSFRTGISHTFYEQWEFHSYEFLGFWLNYSKHYPRPANITTILWKLGIRWEDGK